jgi:hypothetical protein
MKRRKTQRGMETLFSWRTETEPNSVRGIDGTASTAGAALCIDEQTAQVLHPALPTPEQQMSAACATVANSSKTLRKAYSQHCLRSGVKVFSTTLVSC